MATRTRLRSEKSVLRYALRQNRYVATPPLAIYNTTQAPNRPKSAIYPNKPSLSLHAHLRGSRTFWLKNTKSAMAFSEPMYASEPWCE